MDLMNVFRQFKLGNCIFRGHYQISKLSFTESKISENDFKRIAQRQFVESLSSKIINDHNSSISSIDKGQFFEYDIELLVLKISDFKTVVEAAIQLMPIERINEIKQGKTL